MKIDEQMKLRSWAEDMMEQKSSGLTRRVWCEKRGIGLRTYEYRCKIVKKKMQEIYDVKESTEHPIEAPALPPIAQITVEQAQVPQADSISVRVGKLSISIPPNSNLEHVKLLMEVVSNMRLEKRQVPRAR